jgi:hypothetical protein
MKFSSLALKCALLLLRSGSTVLSEEITATPSEGVHILYEELFTSFGWYDDTVVVESNIPVNVQRYYDEEYFFMIGMQPVKEGDMKILVTSNCDSSTTSIIPNITVNSTYDDINGHSSTSVIIQLDGAQSTTDFLTPSSYHAIWSYTSRCAADTPGSEGVSTISEKVEGSEELGNPPSSACRSSLLFSMFALLQGVLSKSNENHQRRLEGTDCIFNAEILVDGCLHDFNVTAPSVRAINSTMVNYTKDESKKCTTNYEADLTFITEPVLEGNSTLYVPKMTGDVCSRPIEGRPYVDSLGKTLFATPVIAATSSSTLWSASTHNEEMKAPSAHTDSPAINEQLLGLAWTKSALGEHASIASFAAFAIALMTNGAPSHLVEDALNAALDEVRHARTSFAIASKLRGHDIGPGPLPESKHEFGHDLKALAIAVANEGCIDETLSALEAAYKAERIGFALETELEGTEYSGVDKGTLAWIQKELSIIAMEENFHSALAWRTLAWICSVDSTACNEVKSTILQDDMLEEAYRRRFGSVENMQMMKLLKGHHLKDCEGKDVVEMGCNALLNEAAKNLMIMTHAATNSTAGSCH